MYLIHISVNPANSRLKAQPVEYTKNFRNVPWIFEMHQKFGECVNNFRNILRICQCYQILEYATASNSFVVKLFQLGKLSIPKWEKNLKKGIFYNFLRHTSKNKKLGG